MRCGDRRIVVVLMIAGLQLSACTQMSNAPGQIVPRATGMSSIAGAQRGQNQSSQDWQAAFNLADRKLTDTGESRYFRDQNLCTWDRIDTRSIHEISELWIPIENRSYS